MSSRTQQCFNACAALSALLTSHNVPHAFSGGFLTVALGAEPREIEVRPPAVPRSIVFICLHYRNFCVWPLDSGPYAMPVPMMKD